MSWITKLRFKRKWEGAHRSTKKAALETAYKVTGNCAVCTSVVKRGMSKQDYKDRFGQDPGDDVCPVCGRIPPWTT